jgi:hypothetical protein
MKKYSIVVHPAELLDEIKKIKQDLKSLIGWYSSVNALAHFTICEFRADEELLAKVRQEVTKLIANWRKEVVFLNSFDAFEGGAFYIKPDEYSSMYLQELLKAVGSKVKEIIPKVYTCTNPHLSIGRRLNEEQMEVAKTNLTTYSNSFLCEGVMIREFNAMRKQYDLKEFIQF